MMMVLFVEIHIYILAKLKASTVGSRTSNIVSKVRSQLLLIRQNLNRTSIKVSYSKLPYNTFNEEMNSVNNNVMLQGMYILGDTLP